MKLCKNSDKRVYTYLKIAIQLFTSFVWILCLADTNSYYSVYLLCAFLGAFCFADNYRNNRKAAKLQGLVMGLFSGIISVATVAANYNLFFPLDSSNILNIPLCLLGGFFVFWNIIVYLCNALPVSCDCSKIAEQRNHPLRFFLVSFGIIAVIDLVYLVLYTLPGVVSVDSLHQLNQVVTNTYTNHHPFWHTINIKIIVEIGLALFGNINAAITLYTVLSVLFMAMCFSYAMVTLYQSGVPRIGIIIPFVFYALVPYNVAFSVTMLKDIPFAGVALVFVVAVFRLFKRTGQRVWIDYIMLVGSCLGFCLWRSNGRYAILATVVIFAIVLRKRFISVTGIVAGVLVISWILQGPVLAVMNIKQTQYAEAFSIPAQQIARVITAGCPLTDDEEELLSNIMDVDEIPQLYKEYISDPVKAEIAETGDDYLREHKVEFLKLWIQLGLKYPQHYAAAYVEQTKGYWNGGYDYLVYSTIVHENDLGIVENPDSTIGRMAANLYFWGFDKQAFCQPLQSIGLHVWILLAVLVINLLKKREEALLTIPVIMVIATLLIATPVFSEFRYAYSVFTTLPFIGAVTVFSCSAKKVKTTDIQNVKEEDSPHE